MGVGSEGMLRHLAQCRQHTHTHPRRHELAVASIPPFPSPTKKGLMCKSEQHTTTARTPLQPTEPTANV